MDDVMTTTFPLIFADPSSSNFSIMIKYSYDLKKEERLPWWCSGWESACQCRGHGFEPWSGKIPHGTEQLSLCTTATKPAL